ncbi:N-acetylmuramidase domain-containing protein [Rhizobium sp. RU36D]|uniref:N-acetylmuramidase domain-containing protein n=1 Tax=Rhizobium sp. RU36D TaxID=1907415 RepID=UPI0009D878B8|nr:N-acetylmuramidase domain-containing protein [Rhizobium sp. RU36D]SMD18408.1 Putative peptidoglycan binding domain-containing protein [Rhizobium sp. RU36D]
MNLIGTGLRLAADDYERAAKTIGCEVAAIKAVVSVEAAGAGFDAKNRLKLLPEPHYFHRLLKGAELKQAVAEGLAYKSWGEQPYDRTQDDRYIRLARMMAINPEAALDSCSWGLGQIMGANAETCGYASATDMVTSFLRGEGAQLDGIVGFIIGTGLAKPLARHDWKAFAKGYNGPGYAKNAYDTKLDRAYRNFARMMPVGADPLADGYLSMGDVGSAVIDLQKVLTARSFATGGVDGAFGKLTDQAVRQYQKAAGLVVDGKVGRGTGRSLGLAWAA